MVVVYPEPSADDVPFNDPYSVDLDDGEKVTVTYTPEQSGAIFRLAALAISKHPGTIYEVRDESGTIYGPAAIPPTDIDDLVACWVPAQSFTGELTIEVRNNSGKVQTYHVQPVGYEATEGSA